MRLKTIIASIALVLPSLSWAASSLPLEFETKRSASSPSTTIPYGTFSTPATIDPVFILSIDGGGIRGIIPARILNYVEETVTRGLKEHIRREIERELREDFPTFPETAGFAVHLAHGFQLMAGTSTGGIIALALNAPDPVLPTRPKFNTSFLVSLYRDKGLVIFPPYFGSSLSAVVSPKYDVSALQNLFLEYFGDTKLSQAVSPVFVTAFEMRQESLHLLDSAKAKRSPTEDYLIRDAARSTSAAPTFMRSAPIKDQAGHERLFADGGIIANNPAMAALLTAKDRFPTAKEFVLLSLGTGVATKGNLSALEAAGQLQWAPSIAGVMMDGTSDFTHVLLRDFARNTEMSLDYVRVQPHLTKERSQMDKVDADNISYLLAFAEKTMREEAKELDRVSQRLVQSYARKPHLLFPHLHAKVTGPLSTATTATLALAHDPLNQVTAWAVSQALRQYPASVTELDLTESTVGDQEIRILVRSDRLTPLRKLILTNNTITKKGAVDIGSLTNLTAIHLDGNAVGSEGVGALMPLAASLTQLSIAENALKDEGAEIIAKSFRALVTLDVSKNGLTQRGVHALMVNLPLLTRFNLSRNEGVLGVISGFGARENKSLTDLDLSHNKITDEQVAKLTGVLRANTTLRSLSLYFNTITPTAAPALETLLMENRALTSLNLGNNNLGDDGIRPIAQALETNRVLLILDCSHNNIHDIGAAALATAMTRNRTLTSLVLRKNAFTNIGIPLLTSAKEAAQKVNTLFRLAV